MPTPTPPTRRSTGLAAIEAQGAPPRTLGRGRISEGSITSSSDQSSCGTASSGTRHQVGVSDWEGERPQDLHRPSG